jgi:hypothetical protein
MIGVDVLINGSALDDDEEDSGSRPTLVERDGASGLNRSVRMWQAWLRGGGMVAQESAGE